MGGLTAIGFTPGRSLVHRLDPRTKQVLLLGWSTASLWGQTTFLIILTTVLMLGLTSAGLRVREVARDVRYFFLFLVFVFIVRVITLRGGWMPAIDAAAFGDALIVCWRLLLVVVMGLLVMATTRIADIRAALVWLLKPIPLVDGRMAATMVGLVVRLLPLILVQAALVSDAQRARGIDRRRNPLVRLKYFSIALFRAVFLRADDLAAAMQARCYRHDRALPELVFARCDAWVAGAGVLVGLTAMLP